MKNPQALCYNKFRLRTEDFFCPAGAENTKYVLENR